MAPVSRDEAIATLEEGRARVDGSLAGFPQDVLTRPGTIGGGSWSAKDVIGHLAWWEEIALRTLDEWRAGGTPWIEGVFAEGAEGIDRINAEDHDRKAGRSLDKVRAQAEHVHKRLLAEISGAGDEEWRSKPSGGAPADRELWRVLASVLGAPKRPFGHAFAHIPDLEAFAAASS